MQDAPPTQVAANVHVGNKTRLDLCCILGVLYPRCAVSSVCCILGVLLVSCFCQCLFVVPFSAEMAHQSPYRTGVLFLPIWA